VNRRTFLKILGVSSAAFILPYSIQRLVDHVASGSYDEKLLRELFGDILNKITPEEFEWLDSLNETYYLYQFDNDITVTKNPKAKYFRDKIISLNGKLIEETSNIFEASIKEYEFDKQLGKVHNGQPYFWPRVRSRRAVIDRPNNKKWMNSRGVRHEYNSNPIQSWIGEKIGNSRWGNLDIINVKLHKKYESFGHAAKDTGMTLQGVSQIINGKREFGCARGSKIAYKFKKLTI